MGASLFMRLGRFVLLPFCLGSGSALAQESYPAPGPQPSTPTAPPSEPQSSVTVVAAAPGYRSSIDRRSYSIEGDLQKSTGSLGDVLRQVPSVQVDVDGTVSVRGDPNVTILVDGKPSALFSGPAGSQALQSMSADQFARVEVMTNPPAGVTAEGGAVINLISKTGPKHAEAPTQSVTLKADYGSSGRFDLGANGVYGAPGLTLSGGAEFRRSGFVRDIGSRFGLPDGTNGDLTPAEELQTQREHDDVLTMNGAIGYDLDSVDRLEAGANAELGRLVSSQNTAYQTEAQTGPLALDYDGPAFFHAHFSSTSESLGITRTLPGEAQSVSFKVELSQNAINFQNGAAYAYTVPLQPNLYQDLTETASFPQLDLKIDYKTALPNKAKLTFGYEGTFDWQTLGNQGLQGPSAEEAILDPVFAQRFRFDQQVNALYVTYDQSFGRLSLQPGLRLEATSLETDLVAGDQRGRQDYFEAYPSLHLDYALNDASQLKASYGRRTERPDQTQLDPFRIEINQTLFIAGNPDVRPSFTQSYELGYEYRVKTTDFQSTLFYRDKTDLLTSVYQDIGDDVLLSTWANLGFEHDVGLELVGAYAITPKLTINASTDLLRAQASAQNLGIAGLRSAFIASGKVTLNWRVGAKDYLQLGGDASGRQLTAQGYRGGAVFSNLGWRRQFDDRLSAVLTADDPFGLSRRTVNIDTPMLTETDKRKFNAIGVFLGFTYAFGSSAKHGDAFDFQRPKPGG